MLKQILRKTTETNDKTKSQQRIDIKKKINEISEPKKPTYTSLDGLSSRTEMAEENLILTTKRNKIEQQT